MNSDSDTETWLSNWEQHCITSVDEQPNYEQLLITETDNAHRTIWASFQDSATAIAQLYKDRHSSEPSSLWAPFQTAAGSITTLYKDSCDVLRNTSEVAIQCGYQKRNIELFNWAKKRRRHIKREDLLAYLAGKPVQKTNSHYHHSLSHR
ncbi:UPF0472 protein C16orf72 homolog [Agrilus planipennis]|nr:UPF0472 protein C16orf72 homolog [Agrilus planipennis]XP_025836541.1 UPF0472 protein C16orf72 homolog [Agrilus planipennis]